MLLKIDKFFYYQFKEIVNNRYNRWYRLKHSSEILSLSIWIFRMLLAIASKKNILFNDDDDDNVSSDGGKYCRLDPFCYYRLKSNENFFLHSIMFTIMIILIGILESTAIDWPYKYLIINLDDYEQSRRPLKKIFPLFFRKFLCIILTKYSIWKQKHSIELDPMKWSKIGRIDIPQTITLDDRFKIIRFLHIIDPIIFIIHLLLIPPCLLIIIDYYTTIVSMYSYDENDRMIIIIRTLFAFDSIMLIYNILIILQLTLFFAVLSIGCTLLNYSLITRINRLLNKISQFCQQQLHNGRKLLIRKSIVSNRQLFCLYREHCQICLDYQYSYNELWGPPLLCYLILSVPFDSIGLSAYWLNHLTWLDQLNVNLILLFHAITTLLSFIDLAKQTKSMHQTGKYLPTIIQSINNHHQVLPFYHHNTHIKSSSSSLLLKLKLNNLYDRLTRGQKYGPRISLLGSITNKFIFDLFITYIGMFFFILPRI
ncbi:hypothetical protein DERP_014601 [Dermatophagoides pteronyssinus]|uniref:Gustatory receptor n=1 Tax=Dermatophagoides pteronyssinus TaxID=6956 RepID=A0ABQ8IVV7_DERPT|nr:hypothetical protein DERP_014601 [Dermatophagoides pteronyssinus]